MYLKSSFVSTLVLSLAVLGSCRVHPIHLSDTNGIQGVSVSPLIANWSLQTTAPPPVNGSNEVFYPVTVPNTVVGALLEINRARVAVGAPPVFTFPEGAGSDPFFAKNLAAMPTANFTVPWEFTASFNIGDASEHRLAATSLYYVLKLNGVNYAANVTLNGALVANSSDIIGGIRRYVLDIDALVNRSASNALSLTVSPPLNSWSTDLSFSFLDWSPFPADNSMGLWRDVELIGLPRFQTTTTPPQDVGFVVDGVSVQTYLPPSASGATSTQAYVTIVATVRCFPLSACVTVTTSEVSFSLVASTTYPGLQSLPFPSCNQTSFVPSDDGFSAEAHFMWSWEENEALVVQDPQLWWPWQMGGQPLFRISFQLEGHNITQDPNGFQFGLRQMTQSESSGGALQLLVNNIPLLIRGGGWAPDLFYRIADNTALGNESRIAHQLQMVRHMNLNTIRLEGKFEYKSFFELASELGLLVIPGMECCTSWQNWPNWTPQMTTIARLSVRDQVRRLGHYACNVAFLASSDELPPQSIETMYRTVFHEEAWPNPIIAAASEQESNISGSTGVKMTGPYSWVPPVYWLDNVNGESLNYGGAWGFLTEGGPGEAPMTFNSWARTVPAEHVWNATEGGSLSSWWNAHMGNPLGKFASLARYTPPLDARFGPSTSAQEYCYKSQLQNYEGIRAMFEGYSRMKVANATGVIQWMMNDAFPNHLWHLYDNYLVAGGGYYGARRAGEPLHLMLSYVDGTVSLINNLFQDRVGPFTVQANAYVAAPTAEQFHTTTSSVSFVPTDASIDLFALNLSHLSQRAAALSPQSSGAATPYFIELVLLAASGDVDATSWYFMSTQMDVVNFNESNNLWSNCSQWADFTALQVAPKPVLGLQDVAIDIVPGSPARMAISAVLSNDSPSALAIFSHVTVICQDTGLELAPAFWDDNFITIRPLANVSIAGIVFKGNCSDIEIQVQSYPNVFEVGARWRSHGLTD
jgi:exo-1,4-beta-D-glucosaminidase